MSGRRISISRYARNQSTAPVKDRSPDRQHTHRNRELAPGSWTTVAFVALGRRCGLYGAERRWASADPVPSVRKPPRAGSRPMSSSVVSPAACSSLIRWAQVRRLGHRVIELGVEVIEHLADSLDVVQFGAADAEISAVWIDPEIESTEREGSNTPAAHRSRAPPARSGGALV